MSQETLTSPTRTPSRRQLLAFAAAGLLAAGALATEGMISRARGRQELAQWTDAQSIPTVALAEIKSSDAAENLVLPGDIQPFNKAAIYARVSGYLKSWEQDIGAKVKAGQTLATIDSPDLDQQLAQAKADLATAEANEDLAVSTASRYAALVAKQIVSQQVMDEKQGDADAKKAAADAAKANLRRLKAMENFKNIVAPFDGIVTLRNTDVGALINAGNTTGQELFEVSDLSRVRIYVQVPQAYSANLRPGLKATLELPQYPGRKFEATLVTTSNAVDVASRSIRVELQADNTDDALLGGAYCRVAFQLPGNANNMRVPATALISSDRGSQVAILTPEGKAVFRQVQLGRDFGDSVEVTSGLTLHDKVIDSPPETLRSGDIVRLAAAPASGPTTPGPKFVAN